MYLNAAWKNCRKHLNHDFHEINNFTSLHISRATDISQYKAPNALAFELQIKDNQKNNFSKFIPVSFLEMHFLLPRELTYFLTAEDMYYEYHFYP